ncbi:Variant-specific surface protein, partial [Giardia duodenalis]
VLTQTVELELPSCGLPAMFEKIIFGIAILQLALAAQTTGKNPAVICAEDKTRNRTYKTQCTQASPSNCQVDHCTRCATGNPAVCEECEPGYTANPEKTQCTQASNTECGAELKAKGCATCTGTSQDQTCLTCGGGKKVLLDRKSCGDSCPPNSAAKQNVCECNDGFNLNDGKTACEAASNTQCNTPNCKACDNPKTDREVCTECNDNNYLTPTNQCIPDCTTISGYYGDTDKKCKACSSECAECVGPTNNQCSSCPAGKALTYGGSDPAQGGTCGDACTADKNGCKVCGARIGGTDYCSQCSMDTQAPLNGVCTANARVQFCTQVTGGSCTSCSGGYFLKDGGCYKPDQQPGKQVCTQANGGKCQTCANGLAADNGDCSKSACHSTCATCTEANQPDKCSACPPGRYLDATNACKLCTETSSSIQGVANCASCAPPSNNQGPVLCYLMKGDSTGGSVNRSGLSTGAIAGISVAVIVVVGGLVGFLCWWFLCRGKA